MNTEALSAYLCMHFSLNHSLNSKIIMNERMYKVIKMLQKIIEKFTFMTKSSSWAKNFWNSNCLKIVMKSRWLQIIWKIQSTLNAWNEYLKHNDHKNKIIQQAKCAHLNHKCMSWVMHLSQYDASQNESELKVNYLKNFLSFQH